MRKRGNFSGWVKTNWIALSALVLSMASFSVTVEECNDTRLHEQPRLEYTYSYDGTGAGWRLINSGLGPARLRGFKITVDGKSQQSYNELCRSLGLGNPDYGFTNPRIGDLYAAGLNNVLFWIKPSPAANALQDNWTRVNIEACYCSIHNQCWRSDILQQPNPNEDPRDDSCSTFTNEKHTRWWGG
jgi:hypothetical protein